MMYTENYKDLFDLTDDEWYLAHCISGDYALPAQHRGMRHAPRDVLPVHPAVKTDGGIEIISQFTGFSAGHASPHFCHIKLLTYG